MNRVTKSFALILLSIIITGCGLQNVRITVDEPPAEAVATVVPEVLSTTMPPTETSTPIPVISTDTPMPVVGEPGRTASDTKPIADFMPKVNTFSEADEPVWGDAFCPTTMPLCLHPFAIAALGEQQVLQVEIWGTGDHFAAGNEKVNFKWEAYDSNGTRSLGQHCGSSTDRAAHYEAGFGHLTQICFNLDERPERMDLSINSLGNSFVSEMIVDAGNYQSVGEYNYAANARPAPSNEPFAVGPATVTIHSIADKGNYLLLEVTVQTGEEKVLVASPDWIVVGSVISFYTANNAGNRAGWDEAKMGAYETVGGAIEAGEVQTGFVVLQKTTPDAVLLINYGPSLAIDTDAAIFLLGSAPQAVAGGDNASAATTIEVACHPGSGADFADLIQSQPRFVEKELRCANFANAILAQPRIRDSDFSGAIFTGAELAQGNIAGTKMIGVDFSGAVFAGTNIIDSDFKGAVFQNNEFVDVTWQNTICPNGQNSGTLGGSCANGLEALPVEFAAAPATPETVANENGLGDEWYEDSDGNFIPDFIETEAGFDPLIDDCAPNMCTAQLVGLEEFRVAPQGENVLIILDSSGSMAQPMSGQTRMAVAKSVLQAYVAGLPSTAQLGFLVYGHEGDGTDAGKPASCAGIELLGEVGAVSVDSIAGILETFSPNGWTPIGEALAQAEGAFAGMETGQNRIILVTDGLETCGGDPVSEAARLHTNPDIRLVVDVVGFDIQSDDERAQLAAIAEAGGGEYKDVRNLSDFVAYAQIQIARGRAILEYATCVGQEVLVVTTCQSRLHLAATTSISTKRLGLATDISGNHEAELADLDRLQERIDEWHETQQALLEEWDAEAEVLLQELQNLQDKQEAAFEGLGD